MVRRGSSKGFVLALLCDGKPMSHRDLVKRTGLSDGAVWSVLYRMWKKGLVLRTRGPLFSFERRFRGRAGVSGGVRPYHLYVLRPKGEDSVLVNSIEFVKYHEKYLDVRGGGKRSKAEAIKDFLAKNRDKAWFSTEVAEALKGEGVKVSDIMANVRRFEKRGMMYVRGYQTEERQTPFKEGYLITWLDEKLPREQAIEEAIQRTNKALEDRISASPSVERIHRFRDTVIEHSKLRRLVGFPYIQNKLGCTEYESKHAVKRGMQLYRDLREVKIFNNYRYYHHTSLLEEDLQAAIKMKENYIRITKGRENRIGHNWEAVAEWFIDRFTTGAHFWTQNHRTKTMDPRRITIHLIRGVGGRIRAAEVDRVWDVTPGVFAPSITYVLSCKWGIIRKYDVDDFFNVLKWSKEFGTNTPEGRQVKQGVVGVFAGGAFNPKENVQLKDGKFISLSSYASRMNTQLLKAADFNSKLRERGCTKSVTVQKVCRIAKHENEVREILDAVWEESSNGEEILAEVAEKNKGIYDFEKKLENTR